METHSLMMSGLKNIKTHKIFDIEYNGLYMARSHSQT